MLVAVDVGNTNIVFGFFEGESLMENFRMTTKAQRTADEMGLVLLQYLQCVSRQAEDVEAVVISSVVSAVMRMLLFAGHYDLLPCALVLDV